MKVSDSIGYNYTIYAPRVKKLFEKVKLNSLIYCIPTDFVEEALVIGME